MAKMIYLLQNADMLEDIEGDFYVIENFPYPQFVTDENGAELFKNYNEAWQEALDCQDGHVIIF